MMDIEKLQKINMLAKELVQHGICKTMDEAYRQAGRSIESQNPLLLHPDEEKPVQTVQGEVKQEESSPNFQKTVFAQSTQEQQTQYGAFEIRRLQEQVAMLERQMSQMVSKMNEMVTEVNTLQTQKNGMVSHPVSNGHVQQSQAKIVDTSPAMEVASAPVQQKASEAHPRSGGYKSGDVAIEKMFYFGGGGRR